MSDPSTVNLEFFRKEAKTLLKQCRSVNSAAIGRIRVRLPHFANVDDAAAATGIKLADVQHVLAQERGYASWARLKEITDQRRFDEIYSDGDVRKESDHSGIFTFSYGEYVRTLEQIDYRFLMKRAKDLARFHMWSLAPSELGQKLNIVKREWFCAASPDIAVIHIYVSR